MENHHANALFVPLPTKKCFDDHLKDGAKRRHNNGMEIIKSENNNKRFMLDEIV